MIPRGAKEVAMSRESARLTLVADLNDSPFLKHGFKSSATMAARQGIERTA